MDEKEILKRIESFDVADVDRHLQRNHQMQDHLNALRGGEVQAHKEWVNSSELTFPDDFAEGMNNLSSDLHQIEELLKQLDRIEDALKNRKRRLMKGQS